MNQEEISIIKKFEENSPKCEYLKSALKGQDVRSELMNVYAGHPYGERLAWHDMALFKEAGPIGIITGTCPYSLFDGKEGRLRKRIFSLIKKLPYAALADFREFVILTARIIERVGYVCAMALVQFCEREKGDERESCDIRPYMEYFTNKLFWEMDVLYGLKEEKYMKDFCSKYESWIHDKILTEEVVE